MKLRTIFSMNTTRLSDALKNNDAVDLQRLRPKKEEWFAHFLQNRNLGRLTTEMADVFVHKFTETDWHRWGYKKNSRNTILCGMMCEAAQAGRADLMEVYFGGGLDFNRGQAGGNIMHYILTGALADDVKAESVKKILAGGFDKMGGLGSLIALAAAQSGTAAFDHLAEAAGADVHRDNEELLRSAAKAGQRDMCRHLVERYDASLDVAITTSRTLGNQDVWNFLEAVRAELKPGESAPPTIESLAEEVRDLKAAVRELMARAEARDARDAERQIDKPLLSVLPAAPSPAKLP